jgi:tetratricopeptide (TPR) repeat protein
MTSLGSMMRAGAWTIFPGYGLLLLYILLWRRWMHRAPKAAWFLALSVLVILPVSNLVPIATLTVAPYRAALAGIGVATLLGYALGHLWIGGLASRRPAIGTACVLLGLVYAGGCGALSAWNAMQWSDERQLFSTLARCDPDSLFARIHLMTYDLETNAPKQAGKEAEATLTRLFGSTIWRQPEAALRAFHADPAIGAYIRSGLGIQSEPPVWISVLYSRLSSAWLARGDLRSSNACLGGGLLFDNKNVDINLAVGRYDCAVGKYAEAVLYLECAQWAEPDLPATYLLLGQACLAQKQWAQAAAQFQTLIGLQPWLGPAYLGLANAQQHLGDAAGAQRTLQSAQRRAVLTADQAQRLLDSASK